MENLLDSKLQNKEIKEAITTSIKSLFPIESATKRLVLDDIYIQDNLDDLDFPQQKEIKLNRKSWQYPIYAKLAIEDTSTGRVLAKTEKIKIGNIPKITNRFTAILDGNEYQTTNQLRRKAGIYSRIKKNGELEAEFNLAKGLNFKMELDPISQNFVVIFANRQYRLWTLLNILGIGDTEIKKIWGNELLEINKRGALNTEVSEMTSIYKRLFRKEPKSYNDVIKGLREYFTTGTSIDPGVTKLTLGQEFRHLNAEALLATSKKLLNISKGEEQPDDRDSLIFKRLLSVNDLLDNYFEKQIAVIKRKLQRSLGLKDKINEIISTATFGEPIKRFFTTGDLTSAPPQTNPVAMVDAWRKTTPMGTGGIGTSHAITLETRDVQPTHLGFLDVLATPESSRIGTTVSLTSETKKLKDDMVTPVVNKNNELKWLNPLQFYSSKVGFPDEYRVGENKKSIIEKPEVMAMSRGEVKKISSKEVDYYIRSPKSMFSFPQNLIPFMANTQGNRASTGARMMSQAVSLTDKEAPLVRTRRDNTSTYEDLLGSFLNTEAGVDGIVTNIDKNYIYIKPDKSKEIKKIGLYDNFPLNQDGFLDSKVLVNIGDRVKPETTLSENNYSTGKILSLGKNLVTAFLSYRGYNFEDGIVMSQSAAKKLSHDMIHKLNVFFSPKLAIFDLQKFKAWYPDLLTLENTKKLDSKGVIKIGTTVSPGEAVCAFLVEQELDDIERALKKLDKYTFGNYKKHVTLWEEEDPGVVTDIRHSGKNIDIYIKAKHPLKEGDKVTNRFGGKGIITKLVPDDEMPQRAKGLLPIDIILSPEGVPGRMNIGQILETAAGKIAEKTKKPFIVNNFDDLNVDTARDIYDQMKKLDIEPNEILTDGLTGQKIKTPIFVGNQYILKLRHIVIKKEGIHNTGIYDIDEQPTGKGAQKTGTMETYAYIGHGAKSNLAEMTSIKGRKNDDYWRDLQFGLPPSRPNRNFVWDKFTTYLKGMGVNTEKEGNRIRILPLTDDDTEKLSNGKILDPGAMLVGKNLAMRKDGLFDATITGGPKGSKWSHLDLVTRIPNPMFEDAIIKALDLTQQGYLDILAGKKELNGKTGMSGIVENLKKIDVSSTIKKLKDELKLTAPTNVNKLNTKIKYLSALKDFGYTPIEAYTISKLPIIPPIFRPIYPLPSGDLMVADVNKHYRDVGLMNQGIKNVRKDLLPEDIISNEYHLYNSVKALQGLIEPATYSKEKYKGFLADIAKTKTGFIFDTLWAKRQDLSARSTVTVEPSLGLDEVGLPFNMAYKMFKPFILKDMKESGIKISNALKLYDAKDSLATTSLQNVLRSRPVLLNRAPSLHKHSVQAFKPVLMDGKSIKVNPLIMKAYNLDLDGDLQINTCCINLLDNDIKNYYITIKGFNEEFFNQRKIMSSRFNTHLPYIEGGNYYIINLEDFPFQTDKLKGQKEHITFYEAEKFIKVVAYDEKEQKFVLAHVDGWSVHKDREIWLVNLLNKKQIITDDDERAVYGIIPGTLDFERRKPSESIGMLVPIAKDIESLCPNNFTEINGFGKLKEKIKLTKEVGYIIGTLVGDGWFDMNKNIYKSVNLAGIEKEVTQQYQDFLTHIFKRQPHVGHRIGLDSYGRSEKWVISSTDFAKWIDPLIGKGAKNKHLPPFWFSATREFKIGLISGMLDTDGCISINNSVNIKRLAISFGSISIRLLQEMQQLLLSLGIRSKISFSKKTQVGNDFWILNPSVIDFMKIKNELNIAHINNKKALKEITPNKESSSYVRTDLIPITNEIITILTKALGAKRNQVSVLYATLSKAKKAFYITRNAAKKCLEVAKEKNINLSLDWINIVNNETVTWNPVVSCENTYKKETGYDLTVPGYETFMSVDGIILSNTMSVMTPISTAAINEANEMMPSKILFKHGDNALVPGLSKDYIFGLYTLSQLGKRTTHKFTSLDEAKKSGISWNDVIKINNKETTIGQTMINNALPANYRDHNRPMNEQTVSALLTKIGKEKPKVFADVINSWKDLGAAYSYLNGHTVSLTDFIIDRSYRDNLLKSKLPEIEKIKDKDKRIQALNDLTIEVEKEQTKYLKTKPNYLKDMLDSGSFNKTDSIRQILSMPGLVTNIKGEPIPIPITKSYGEGLNSTSYWNTMYGVRKGAVDRSVNTQDSGALNKALLSVTRRLLVIMADCGTKRGLEFDTDDKNVMDRAALETIPGIIKRNQIIDGDAILKAKAKNIYKIKVRSPLTCEAVGGVCQLCYGLLPNGELPSIGTNVGVTESQALTERSTQLVMRTFHCFHPGNTVYTEDKQLLTLEDVINLNYDKKILDINNTFTKIKKAWKHEISSKIKYLKTKDGHSLISQDNHPIQIAENTYLCKYCGGNLSGKNKRCKICFRCNKNARPNNDVNTFYTDEIKNINTKNYTMCINSFPHNFGTKDWDWEIDAYMIGAYISEGSINNRNKDTQQDGVIWSQLPKTEIHKKYLELLNKNNNGKNIHLYNQKLVNRIKLECGSRSHNKKLPFNILNYHVKDVYKILAGILDGDGTIQRYPNKGRYRGNDIIILDTTSYALANQLIILGKALGIETNMHKATLREISNHQPFKVSFKLTKENVDNLSLYSIKINNIKCGDYKTKFIDKGTIKQIQDTFYSYDYVCDIETESTTLMVNELWVHNSGASALAKGGITESFPRVEQLLKVPANLAGKATLAEAEGTIKSIEKNPIGGYNIKTENKLYIIPAGKNPLVTVGTKIYKGDALSQGPIKPQELGELKTHLDAQQYIVNQLNDIYGNKFYKKSFETVVRGISDNAEITNAPEDSGFLRGDTTTISYIESLNKQRKKQGLEKIEFKPYFKSIDTLNLDTPDWLTQVTTNRVKSGLTIGAAKGAYANLKGKDPIPAYIYADEFGKNTDYEKGEFY